MPTLLCLIPLALAEERDAALGGLFSFSSALPGIADRLERGEHRVSDIVTLSCAKA